MHFATLDVSQTELNETSTEHIVGLDPSKAVF